MARKLNDKMVLGFGLICLLLIVIIAVAPIIPEPKQCFTTPCDQFITILQALSKANSDRVTNFEECLEKVGAVALTFPRQCNYKGQTFVESEPIACQVLCVDGFTPDPNNSCQCIPDEPVVCIAQFDPVCDIDTDTTYSNQCFATGAGAMNTVRGEC